VISAPVAKQKQKSSLRSAVSHGSLSDVPSDGKITHVVYDKELTSTAKHRSRGGKKLNWDVKTGNIHSTKSQVSGLPKNVSEIIRISKQVYSPEIDTKMQHF
jgi:hypothetical protein